MWGYFGVLSAWGLLCVFVVSQKAFGKRLGDHLKIPTNLMVNTPFSFSQKKVFKYSKQINFMCFSFQREQNTARENANSNSV